MSNRLKLGDVIYNCVWLRSVTEEQAIKKLRHLERDQVVNAWKQANGLTKRNNSKVKVIRSKSKKS